MKIFVILFYSILFYFNVIGQNLVSNSNFEQFVSCPNWVDQLSYCNNWFVCRETPDYYNTCSITPGYYPPNCFSGFQNPHSGNAFVGILTFVISNMNNREFAGSQLIPSLIIGKKYYFSFYVNLSGGSVYGTTIASNKMGVKFSTLPYSYFNPAPINNTAHFYTNTIITDTAKWTRINGSFIADSAYSYIMIGNFFDDANTDTLNLSPTNNNYAYYYLDDVCVSPDSLYCENWLGVKEQTVKKEEVTIYPNPCINQLNVKISKQSNTNISIIDITGKVIMQAKIEENEFSFNTEKLAKGLYLVKVESVTGVMLTKFTKE